MKVPEITTYGVNHKGTRMRAFDAPRGVRVTVDASDPSDEDAAAAIVEACARAAVGIERDERELGALRAEVERLRQLVPPLERHRLLGIGCVRMDPAGSGLWLLNRREQGWGSFGVMLDGWDHLFRRYAVDITGHGVDATGPWWEASPPKERA